MFNDIRAGIRAGIMTWASRSELHGGGDTSKRTKKYKMVKPQSERLDSSDRQLLNTTIRNQQDNFEILAWCIRKHLDYTTSFSFRSKSGDSDYDAKLQELMKEFSRKENCDIGKRHSLHKLVRLCEQHVLLDGDSGLNKLQGGKLQAIEGTRIASGFDVQGFAPGKRQKVVQGISLDPTTNEALEYAVCSRGQGGRLRFEQWVEAEDLIFSGEYNQSDSTRGISPLSSAINRVIDIYEGMVDVNAKIKLLAKMGIVFSSKTDDDGTKKYDKQNNDIEPDENTSPDAIEFEFSNGPNKIELGENETATVVESQTPGPEYIEFESLMIRVALLSLDIPMSYFDSKQGSFSVHRADATQYEVSCEEKRLRSNEVYNEITDWIVPIFVARGDLVLPEGFSLDKIPAYEWVPAAIPWLDPVKMPLGNEIALRTGQLNHVELLKKRNKDPKEFIEEESEFLKMAADAGVPLSFGKESDFKITSEHLLNDDVQDTIKQMLREELKSALIPDDDIYMDEDNKAYRMENGNYVEV